MQELRLQASDFWRIGAALLSVDDQNDPCAADADMSPYREPTVQLKDGKLELQEDFLIVPASSIKGVLRHRTCFHYNRLKGQFAEDYEDITTVGVDNCEGILNLFGQIKTSKTQTGHRGRVIIDDISIPLSAAKYRTIAHNAIDRFTGGVQDKMLFWEQMAWQGEITIRYGIIPSENADPIAERAFKAALNDLQNGALALGAAGGRGHGRFEKRRS
jgi:CRISPR/Cas system CSM-associated protein Csm3 (group 7 of RAMP superfamily)